MTTLGSYVPRVQGFANRPAWKVICSALCVGVLYIAVLLIPLPVHIARAFNIPSYTLLIVLVLLLYLLLSRSGWAWGAATYLVVLVLFALPLTYRWQAATYNGNLIGGILPFSDASGYYWEAERLTLGLRFTPFASRRPFFAGFLAVLLSLTGGNLQIALAIMVALNATACYLAAREVQTTHGTLAGAFTLVVLYVFYNRFSGLTLTENLGFCLAGLALAAFWRGARKKQAGITLFGLFLLSAALNARAGAFAILPALVLWGVLYFRAGRRISFNFLIKGLLTVLLPFIINLGLVKAIGSPGGVAFANYAQTFYGLVSGNKGWDQVYRDHPGIAENEVLGLAFEKFKQDPGMLAEGILRAYQDYFKSSGGAFSFTLWLPKDQAVCDIFMWFFTALGLIAILRSPHRERDSAVLFGFAGVLLSVGLVPPIDADRMRAYAATIPFSAFIATMGLTFPFKWVREHWGGLPAGESADSTPDGLLLGLGAGLVILFTVLPVVVKAAGSVRGSSSPAACPQGQERLVIPASPGSFIIVVPNDAILESYLPYIREDDYVRSLASSRSYPRLVQELKRVKIYQVVTTGVSVMTTPASKPGDRMIILVSDLSLLKQNILDVCAAPSPNEWLKPYNYFYALGEQSHQYPPAGLLHQYPGFSRLVRYAYALAFGALFLLALWCESAGAGQPAWRRWVTFLCLGAILGGVLIYLHGSGTLAFVWKLRAINTEKTQPVNGYAYTINLGSAWMDQKRLGVSPVEVFEDGRLLAYPNALHADIVNKGEGRFSVWDGYLLFSTSDNSDPRTNGRSYSIFWPRPLPVWFQVLGYALGGVATGILVYLKLIKNPRNPSAG